MTGNASPWRLGNNFTLHHQQPIKICFPTSGCGLNGPVNWKSGQGLYEAEDVLDPVERVSVYAALCGCI